MHVFVETFPGVDSFSFQASTLDEIETQICHHIPESIHDNVTIRHRGGTSLTINSLQKSNDFIDLQLNYLLKGGKGGFGNQLRAQGSRMRKKKRRNGVKEEDEDDSFRTADGKRIKNIREAKELKKYLENKPEIEQQKLQKKKDKLKSIIDSANEEWNSRQKYSDTEFLEQSEELLVDIRQSTDNSGGSSTSETQSTSSRAKGMDFFDDDDDESSEE